MTEAAAQVEKQRLHDEAAQRAAQAAAAKAAAHTPSATRQALQAAIQRRDAAVAEVARLEAARRQLIDTGHEAFLASEAAEAELKALRTTTTDMLVATALGNAPAGPQKTLRQAEQDAVDAKQRRADTDAARKEIEKRLADAKHSAKWASDNVRTAALAAIGANSAGSLRAYITETARIQRELADRLRAMEWLKAGDLRTLDEATQAVMQNFMEPTRKWPSPETSTVAKWEAVVTALSSDPKARAQIG